MAGFSLGQDGQTVDDFVLSRPGNAFRKLKEEMDKQPGWEVPGGTSFKILLNRRICFIPKYNSPVALREAKLVGCRKDRLMIHELECPNDFHYGGEVVYGKVRSVFPPYTLATPVLRGSRIGRHNFF